MTRIPFPVPIGVVQDTQGVFTRKKKGPVERTGFYRGGIDHLVILYKLEYRIPGGIYIPDTQVQAAIIGLLAGCEKQGVCLQQLAARGIGGEVFLKYEVI